MLVMLGNSEKEAMCPVTEDSFSPISESNQNSNNTNNNNSVRYFDGTNAEQYPYASIVTYSTIDAPVAPHNNINNATIQDLQLFNLEAQSLDYLMNDQKYVEHKKLYLQDHEIETLSKMLFQLHTTPPVFINHHSIRNILKTYFDAQYLKKLTESHRKMTVKGVFISTVVRFLIISRKEEWATVTRDNFLEKYPEFETVESKWELLALIRFDRALAVALQYLQGRGNKQLLLSIGAHLEGSNMQYVTGGQPSPGTKRRVQIFERLSGVRPVKRAKRGSLSGNGEGGVGGEVKKVKKSNKRGRPPTRHLKNLTFRQDLNGQRPDDDEDDENEMEEEDDDSSDSDEIEEGIQPPASLKVQPGGVVKGKKGTTAAFGALDLLSRIASEKFEELSEN